MGCMSTRRSPGPPAPSVQERLRGSASWPWIGNPKPESRTATVALAATRAVIAAGPGGGSAAPDRGPVRASPAGWRCCRRLRRRSGRTRSRACWGGAGLVLLVGESHLTRGTYSRPGSEVFPPLGPGSATARSAQGDRAAGAGGVRLKHPEHALAVEVAPGGAPLARGERGWGRPCPHPASRCWSPTWAGDHVLLPWSRRGMGSRPVGTGAPARAARPAKPGDRAAITATHGVSRGQGPLPARCREDRRRILCRLGGAQETSSRYM